MMETGLRAVNAMNGKQGLCLLAVAAMLTASTGLSLAQSGSATGDADAIMQRAYELYGGEDSFSRVHFHFEFDQGRSSTVSLVMGFRRDPAGSDVDYRVIMFNESPPDRKDTGFLGLFYRPGAGKEDEMWLYLPELRTTRRLMHQHVAPDPHEGHELAGHMRHGVNPDEFAVSELDHEELMPRWPGHDRHRLTAVEEYEGRPVYRIESTPIDAATSVYGRRVQWIDREDALPLRIEYHEPGGRHVKTQTMTWRLVGEAWVWERVVAVNHVNGNRTVLEQADVRVNIGLPDDLFSRRVLSRGAKSFEGRVERLSR